MKLDIPPSGHGPRLILVRLCGFTSRLEEHGNGIAVFLCYYPTEAFTVGFLSYCVGWEFKDRG